MKIRPLTITNVLLGVLVLAMLVNPIFVGASHQPANKTTASGSETEVMGPGEDVIILSHSAKISGPKDVVLSVTAECSILTSLITGGTGPDDSSEVFGQVRMWVTIDDKVVPVSSDDAVEPGKVVFCNRAYGRSVEDADNDGDVDVEDDFIRTRTANAFNWLALNVGFDYDNPDNGNNIVDIELHAELTEQVVEGRGDVQAAVGHRTLIASVEKVSNHESIDIDG